MKHLLIFLSFVALWHGVNNVIMCQTCHHYHFGCEKNPNFLARCPEGAEMCFVRIFSRSFYQRGCVSPKDVKQWAEYTNDQHNLYFSCYGSNCNNMDIVSERSDLYCVKCRGSECNQIKEAERCLLGDIPLGPTLCYTRYDEQGRTIEEKDCYNTVRRNTWHYKDHKEQYFPCANSMCNYLNEKALSRCVDFNDFIYKYDQRKMKKCYGNKAPYQNSSMEGCFLFFRYIRIEAGCNSLHNLQRMIACKKAPTCQLCFGDMCNDITIGYVSACLSPKNESIPCNYTDSMCYGRYDHNGKLQMGCVTEDTPGLHHADMLLCRNGKEQQNCMPFEGIESLRGCYECSYPFCDDVLVNLGYTAKTICPVGTTHCYSARRADGVTFRGCYTGITEGVKVCNNTMGACKICKYNYCNYDKVITKITGQCYKSNWKKPDKHETTLRFTDCKGSYFFGRQHHCFIASSTRLFMRMGCVSELVGGIDESYSITYGGTEVAWLYQNSCYKCASNAQGYCFAVDHLKPEKCAGYNKYPARGCYTLIDRREHVMERGCITELNDYMMQLCNMPIFFEKCQICTNNGCNNEEFMGW